MIKMLKSLNQQGQSLLEVTVLVGLALVTISGLVIVTVNGLKNSQYSQNQAQATKLAQEGMDQVKSIVQRNCSVSLGGNYFWFNSLTNGNDLVWSRDWSGRPTFRIVNYNTCTTTIPGLTPAAFDTVPDPAVPGAIFTRVITISDDNTCTPSSSCKIVAIRVFWNDYSGAHESRLVTILTEN